VRWNGLAYKGVDCDYLNYFQLTITNGADSILSPGNNVSFCYKTMGWTTSDMSGGLGGWGNPPATVGVNKGNKSNYARFGAFNYPGTAYAGPSAVSAVNWLNDKSFTFNTCMTGNTIPPVIIKIPEENCDTLTMCTFSTLTVTASFLNPQQGQTSILSAACTGMAGVTIVSATTTNNISTIVLNLSSGGTAGIHTLNITATDNSFPAQTTTLPVTISVDICPGINEIGLRNEFNVYPNPGNGIFTVQINNPASSNNYEAKIYDILGKSIYSTKMGYNNMVVDISSYSAGIYFLKLYKEGSLYGVEKLIVK
jgi:hypothetical protein